MILICNIPFIKKVNQAPKFRKISKVQTSYYHPFWTLHNIAIRPSSSFNQNPEMLFHMAQNFSQHISASPFFLGLMHLKPTKKSWTFCGFLLGALAINHCQGAIGPEGTFDVWWKISRVRLIDQYPLLNPRFLLGKQFRREVGLPWLNDFEWFLNVYYKRFCDNSVSSPTWHDLLPVWHNFCILGCTNQGKLLQFIKGHLQGGFSLTQRN